MPLCLAKATADDHVAQLCKLISGNLFLPCSEFQAHECRWEENNSDSMHSLSGSSDPEAWERAVNDGCICGLMAESRRIPDMILHSRHHYLALLRSSV